jgi:glutamate-1-semialdehyde aminotransferase
MMSNYQDQMVEAANTFAENLKKAVPGTPEVKFNKSGFEIRSEVLGLAKDFTQFEFDSRAMGYHTALQNGAISVTAEMPEVPTADEVLETAKKFYDFVNNK